MQDVRKSKCKQSQDQDFSHQITARATSPSNKGTNSQQFDKIEKSMKWEENHVSSSNHNKRGEKHQVISLHLPKTWGTELHNTYTSGGCRHPLVKICKRWLKTPPSLREKKKEEAQVHLHMQHTMLWKTCFNTPPTGIED